jgi:phage terminase large subunit
MTGTFFDSHNKNRAHWVCIKAGLKDCPHISEAKVQRIIDKYGENHPFTRSCVYGEFMEQDDQDQFIFPHSAVMHALENPPKHRSGMRIGFVDFAEGTAEHVLAVRDGNKTEIALAFREANKHAACSRLIRGFMLAGLKEEQIWGDAADKEALDILVSLGWTIHRQNFGAPARNSEQFQSWSAESWIDASIGVSKGELIVPNDELLIAQLTSRKRTITGRGKLGAEEKYDMRKRGVESPDRGDAWCGANNVYDSQQLTKSPFSIPSDWMDQVERSQEHEAVAAMGGGWGL